MTNRRPSQPAGAGPLDEALSAAIATDVNYLVEVFERAARFRGDYINWVITTEGLLDDVLAIVFCSTDEERELFLSFVTPQLGLATKTRIFRDAVEARFPGLELKWKWKWLAKELEQINTFRNRLAHWKVELGGESLRDKVPGQIKLLGRGARPKEVITEAELGNRSARVRKVNRGLATLLSMLAEVE